MAHILASMMFSLTALTLVGLIAAMLAQSRTAIVAALGGVGPDRVRRYRAPVRVKIRRTVTWPASRAAPARRAA